MSVEFWQAMGPEYVAHAREAIARAVWDEAMADPAFVAGLEAGKADIAAGRVHKWEDVKKELAMTDERDPEPAEITTDTDAEDATPADVDAVPDVVETPVTEPEDDR